DTNKATYMDEVHRDYRSFRKSMLRLTEQHKILEKTTLSSARRARLSTEYIALPTSDKEQLESLKASGYRLVNWLPEK
ncbi:hypothetical protein EAY71_24530, partial [Vibrio anguillarum]